MNAKYYEYVNEKKKRKKIVVGVESTTLNMLINCSTIFTITFPYIRYKFYIKGKPCPETHNFKMLGGRIGTLDLWISSLPLYHLSQANHVNLRNC
jgi:hypothetical protein